MKTTDSKSKKTTKNIDPDSKLLPGYNRFRTKLQKRIKDLRDERELTQQHMEKYEINYRTYERIESDINNITTIWQMYKIAKAYDMTISELFDV